MYTQSTQLNTIIRDTDGASIPFAEGNIDYEEYLAWVAVGNTPTPLPVPTAAELLLSSRTAQSQLIDMSYAQAIYADLLFTTAAGVQQVYQADSISQTMLLAASVGYTRRGAVPVNFFWKAKDNTQVAFTLADLNGLYDTMLDRGDLAFDHRTAKKVDIGNALDPAVVKLIVW